MPKTTDHSDHANVVAMPPFVFLASLVLGFVIEQKWSGTLGLSNPMRYFIGVPILLAGIVMGRRFSRVFKRSGQDLSPNTATPTLLTTGIYGFSRNPAYVSIALAQAGIAIMMDSTWIILALVPAIAVIHYGVVLREEAYLERKFGDEYLSYKAQVRRWL